mmetsp:Transcript_11025/g.26975  ORF Transcript_11025/g.26975 Transcript_11025/m.26975 type:complete len:266 (-) Transcript_11025:802-1599(-)|eukprot:g7325.t1
MGCGASVPKASLEGEQPAATAAAPAGAAAAPDAPQQHGGAQVDLEKVFRQFDTNKDGKLDKNELKRGLKAVDLGELDCGRLLTEMGDGKVITLENWKEKITAEIQTAIAAKLDEEGLVSTFRPVFNIAKVFQQFDSDSSGALSLSEMLAAFAALGLSEETCKESLKNMDTSADGEIQLDEWRKNLDTKMYQKIFGCLDEKGLVAGLSADHLPAEKEKKKGGGGGQGKKKGAKGGDASPAAAGADEAPAATEDATPAAEAAPAEAP